MERVREVAGGVEGEELDEASDGVVVLGKSEADELGVVLPQLRHGPTRVEAPEGGAPVLSGGGRSGHGCRGHEHHGGGGHWEDKSSFQPASQGILSRWWLHRPPRVI